jgi:cytochrome b involved in lipid metabolism
MPTDTIDKPLLICREEISRLQSIERGLVKSTNGSFTVQGDVEDRQQAPKDANKIRKYLAMVVLGLGLFATGFAMAPVLAVVKPMKGSNADVQLVLVGGESGGSSPATFEEELQMLQGTDPHGRELLSKRQKRQRRKRRKRKRAAAKKAALLAAKDDDSDSSEDMMVPAPAPGPAVTTRITPQQLANHNTANALWTELYGTVYDFTAFARSHPGGRGVIVAIAGKGGRQLFETQHSRNLLNKYSGYIVGTLGSAPIVAPPAPVVPNPAPKPAPPAPVVVTPRTISVQELALHNNGNDLWTEIYGIVYDLTAFAGTHLGGSGIIVGVAGQNGMMMFESFHAPSVVTKLDKYMVAPLG